MSVDEWAGHRPDSAVDLDVSTGDGWDEPAPELLYPNLIAFVTDWLVPMYRRSMENREYAWCPQWWRHPEAVLRLSALWRGFEEQRRQPGTAMSAWIRDHLDHHLPLLMDADRGPLRGCTAPKGHAQRPLQRMPLDASPAGLDLFLT